MASDYTRLFFLIVLVLFTGFISLSYYHQSTYYTSQITELNIKLIEAEEKTYALGENLLNKKHTFDFKFIITDQDAVAHEFYTHKHILRVNSEYFDILLTHNKTDEVHYSNVSKQDFLAIVEILYLGIIRTDIPVSSLPTIIKYLDNFMILNKYSNYTDNYFAYKFNNYEYNGITMCRKTNHQELNNVDIIAKIYSFAKKYNLPYTRLAVLNNIYYNWRVQKLFTEEYLAKYPGMFYDYVKFLRCDKAYLSL